MPTDEIATRIRAGLLSGFTQEQVAARVGLDAKTMRKYYREVCDFAEFDGLVSTGATMFQLANGRAAQIDRETGTILREEIKPDVAAGRYILRTRGRKLGWAERLELTGAGGDALFRNVNFAALSDAELDQFIALCGKIGLRFPGASGIGTPPGEPAS